MLSSVLNDETAFEININIMRAFVTVRQYLTSANGTIKEIEELKQRMKALEQGSEDTIAAINDLSEDTRRNLMISIWFFRSWPISRNKLPLIVSR